jgi:hypothetical protein
VKLGVLYIGSVVFWTGDFAKTAMLLYLSFTSTRNPGSDLTLIFSSLNQWSVA